MLKKGGVQIKQRVGVGETVVDGHGCAMVRSGAREQHLACGVRECGVREGRVFTEHVWA